MNVLKKLGCAAAIAMAVGTAHAVPVMNNWTFNPNGGGIARGLNVGEYLDVNGNGFIQINATGRSFTFTEHAVFNLVQADGQGALFPMEYAGGNISATLEARGAGTFGGAFTFTGGTIRMYQNPDNGEYSRTDGFYGANLGVQIAEFNVLAGGGGQVDATGNPTSNGQVSIFAEASAGKLKAGYFFSDTGVDMSTLQTRAFAFTNANTVGKPGATLVSEVACQFAGFKGAGCDGSPYSNAPGRHFFVGNNGQFKFADIPEPASVALFGIALLGLGTMRRRMK